MRFFPSLALALYWCFLVDRNCAVACGTQLASEAGQYPTSEAARIADGVDNLQVPISVLDNDLSNSIEVEEEEEESAVIDDDITTHGLERLSSAATCLVAGVEYTHGQQIYRRDQCEFCLCLDGEMFCWWQECPPAMEGPCRDRAPFSPCLSVPANPSSVSTKLTTTSTTTTTIKSTTKATSSSASVEAFTSTENMTESPLFTEETNSDYSSEDPSTSTSEEPKHCIVMGREYQIGDQLPHDTGNCIECVCGRGAKVTCSPHQCATAGADDINDFHAPPGRRQPVPDVF